MSESQAATYAKIVANKDTDSQKNLIDKLRLMARKPVTEPESVDLVFPEHGAKENLIEVKLSAEQRGAIDRDTRAMFKQMKTESVAGPGFQERNYLITPHREVYDFLPPFIKMIATELQKQTREGDDNKDGNYMIEQLMRYIVDQGIAREQVFGKKIALGQEMLNRAAFSTYVINDREKRRQHLMEQKILAHDKYTQDSLDDEVDAMYTFRQIDIKDFRASDFAVDEQGNKGADYTMNKVAQKVNKSIATINNTLKMHGMDANVAVCRYGGDELGLGFMGVSDPGLRNLIYGVITGLNETDNPDVSFDNGVKAIDGYFNRAGEVKKEKVDLKAGLEEIQVPKDRSKRKIFWEQFSIGLILNDDEITDIEESRKKESGGEASCR